jgi:tetratricopeptide (TPR) repeat protein
VNRALALRPQDLDLHPRRVRLANWAGDYAQAEESLRAIIDIDPENAGAKRDLARLLGWQGRLDASEDLLSAYLSQHPDDKEALLDYARVQSWRGNFDAAADILGRYRDAGGDDLAYRRELALVLAWGDRSSAALRMADSGLAQDPSDFKFHFARAVALRNLHQWGQALAEVDRLQQLRPGAPETLDLRRTIETARRPYTQLDGMARRDSDQIFTAGTELSYHQPVSDVWTVMAGAGADFVSAKRGGGLAPIRGGTSMTRGSGWVGAGARLGAGAVAAARIGGTAAEDVAGTGFWEVSVDSRVWDDLRARIRNFRDFQMVSPRALSLGITRIDTEWQLTYTPDFAWTIEAVGREAELSDRNRYLRAYVAPRRAVLRTERWNVDLGVSGNWYGYSEDPGHGYYAPNFYQQYSIDTYVYYKLSYEDGVSLVFSPGAHKDDRMRHFAFTAGVLAEGTFGSFSDWMSKLRAGYTNNGSDYGRNYSSEFIGFTLVRRF